MLLAVWVGARSAAAVAAAARAEDAAEKPAAAHAAAGPTAAARNSAAAGPLLTPRACFEFVGSVTLEFYGEGVDRSGT